MKKILGFICMALVSYSTSSFSTVVLDIQGGVLMGAENVNVNGSLYDVSFQDGTCFNLFDGCNDSSDFPFPVADATLETIQSSNAYLAAQALLDQVFLNTSLGLFDTDPTLTNGCTYWRGCFVYTPIFATTNGVDYFHSVSADNWATLDTDSVGVSFGRLATGDFYAPGTAGDGVLAIWSNSVNGPVPPITTVPVPGVLWLFGSGLIGFFGVKRKVSK